MALAFCALLSGCGHLPARFEATPFRVMTYNIRSGNGALAETAAEIQALSPEVVALQEVDVHWGERSGYLDEATLLGNKLGMHVCFAPIYRLPPLSAGAPLREFGVALLSRYKILACRNRVITRLSTQDSAPVPAPMPGFLDATVAIGGEEVRVFDTHLDYRADPAVRRRQVADMLAYIGDASSPTILTGDLNAGPDAPELQPLFALLRDAWPATDTAGRTYPADDPKKRIDYVLLSKHFRVESASVPVTLASDHRPVLIGVVLPAR